MRKPRRGRIVDQSSSPPWCGLSKYDTCITTFQLPHGCLLRSTFRRRAYSSAACGSWIEQRPMMTSRRVVVAVHDLCLMALSRHPPGVRWANHGWGRSDEVLGDRGMMSRICSSSVWLVLSFGDGYQPSTLACFVAASGLLQILRLEGEGFTELGDTGALGENRRALDPAVLRIR